MFGAVFPGGGVYVTTTDDASLMLLDVSVALAYIVFEPDARVTDFVHDVPDREVIEILDNYRQSA